ncbi:hypothetical protein KSC_057060 [Ktedonobacter sp. SOSP1-52]|nr:hypothetical protein KSC_057060 [Ktedonobacter sp. SOSP1-52]
MRPPIEAADEIVFNIGRTGLTPGSLTAQEFQFVMENAHILMKTTFLFGPKFWPNKWRHAQERRRFGKG